MGTARELLKIFETRRDSGGIYTGNAITNVQQRNILRPWSETDCNGNVYPPGHLQKCDLSHFKSVPKGVMDTIAEEGRTKTLVLYRFFYRNTNKQRVDLGWVLTELGRNSRGKLLCSVTERGLTLKQRNCFYAARDEVAEKRAAPMPDAPASAPLPPQRLPAFTPCLSW